MIFRAAYMALYVGLVPTYVPLTNQLDNSLVSIHHLTRTHGFRIIRITQQGSIRIQEKK